MDIASAQLWFSLVVVVLGGIVTYYANVFIGKLNQEYELKKQAYLDFLDVMLEGHMVYSVKALADTKKNDKMSEDSPESKIVKDSLRAEVLWKHNYIKAFFMVELFGSKKVMDLIALRCMDALENEYQDPTRYSNFESDLIEAIKEDLLKRNRIWQFWK
jgi:hypothetical protein